MKTVIIIGAGQLGSRHLQGALLSKNPLSIVVVDPSNESLEIARQRAEGVSLGNASTQVKYSEVVSNGFEVDVCIVATTADIRYAVTKSLLEGCKVSHIIFEKVLFQKESEYAAMATLLKEAETLGWVNCPRRVYPAYEHVKSLVNPELGIAMKVSGSGYGLACNGIHFIDIFASLTGSNIIDVRNVNIDNEVVESKRKGFFEVTGSIEFHSGPHSLNMHCSALEAEEVSIFVELVNGSLSVEIDEVGGSYRLGGEGGETLLYSAPYQSQLTGEIIDEILAVGTSSLTSFDDSCLLHIPFIGEVKKHIEISTNRELDACPIT